MNSLYVRSEARSLSVPANILSIRVHDAKVGWQNKPVSELMMIKGMRGYSCLYWSDGSKQVMAYTIKHYADLLSENEFIRVHQNYVINRKFVQKMQLIHRGPMLRLACGTEIIVSRRRWTLVKTTFHYLLKGV